MNKRGILVIIQSPRVGCTYKHLKHLGLFTFVTLVTSVVSFNVLCNVLFGSNNTFAAPVSSTTSLTITTTDISTSFTVGNSNGTFTTSTPGEFTISTNNYTGYTLNIAASPTNITPNTTNDASTYTKLVNIDNNELFLNSISSASTPEQFNVGNWGFSISKASGDISLVNSNLYQPAPDLQGTTLDITNEANTIDTDTNELIPNTYNITLGIKADYETPVGTYANTYIIEAVANNASYTIYYNANTEDEVTNLPETQSGDTTATSIALASTTPERAHYSFLGWCTVTPTTTNGVDSCEGTNATTYQPNDNIDLDQTISNTTTLYAMWKVDQLTQTTEVRYEVANADGTYGSYTTVDTKNVNYGDSYAWSTANISNFDTITYNSASVASYTVTEAKTNQVNITRKSYVLTINRNTSYISSVSGAGTYKVGKVVSISAAASSGNKFTGWSQTAGTTGSFGSATSASTTFTMPASAATIYANGTTDRIYIQNITTSNCPTSRTLVYDNRDNKSYYIQKIGSLCWMTSNLAYASGASKVDATYGGYYTYDNAMNACPAGWRVPSQTEYETLIATYNTPAKITAAPWYAQLGGRYTNSGSKARYVGQYAYYRTSNVGVTDTSSWSIEVDSSSVFVFGGARSTWEAVRCVAR